MHARTVGLLAGQAIAEDEVGPPYVLDLPLIVEIRQTPRMRYTRSAAERRQNAGVLFAALNVPDPARIAGAKIMVYDDVFTGGNSLNAVAKPLLLVDARSIVGLTLARQSWRS